MTITVAIATVMVLAIGCMWRDDDAPDLRIRGADISFTLQVEDLGRTVRDADGGTEPIEEIIARRGATHVRLRVWVDPDPGTSDLRSALALARRAEAAGLQILLSLHYSDTWADRGAQHTPSAWQGQDFETLRRTVETYTRDVVADFSRQGTPVDMVQIGNEVTRGMLWPSGCLCGDGEDHWKEFTALLSAGAKGARDGHPQAPPDIMIHVDTGGDFESSANFFDQLMARDVDFDLIGLSYYPFWHGPLSDLEHNVLALAHRYDKDIVIAETAYPWTLSGEEPSVVETAEALPDAHRYPPTPEGQAAYFEELNRILREVPDGHGAGYFVWEPGWLPGVGATDEVGSTHANLTLFDWNGRGLPALEAFRPDGGAEEE